jgi:guanine deaminase
MNDEGFLQLAIQEARAGIAAGQSPFGAVIESEGALVAAAYNTVWKDCDPTAHAEINAIRQAAKRLNSIDLSACTIYTTCEPCPMCLAAIHWAKLRRVIFGATIADAESAGFSELLVEAKTLAKMGGSPLKVEPGLLADECRALFDLWHQTNLSKAY